MKKRISVIMAYIMTTALFVSTLTGCGESGAGSGAKNDGERVALFGDESANFMLVRSADASQTVKEAAKDLKDKIEKGLDIKVEYKPDTVAYKADVFEVDIGVTNRTHAQSIYDDLIKANENNAFDYSVQFKDNVLYIVGATDDALVNAINYFSENFCDSKSATIGDAYSYQYHFTEGSGFAIAGETNLSSYSIVTPKYNMSYIVGREVPNLQEALKASTASVVEELMDDSDETECEIIIGNTKREGTPKITDEDEYRITLSGKKLYIIGGSDKATAVAVKELIRMIEEGTEIKGKAEIKGSYKKTVKKYENYYSLTWADEFDAPEIDDSAWALMRGGFSHFGTPTKKLRFLADESSAYMKDGNLHMHVSQDDEYYNSVELRSPGVWFKYGIIECSSKFNISSGIASAFWLLAKSTENYHMELDIFESQGAPNNKVVVTPISHATNGEVTPVVDYCGAIKGDRFTNAAYVLDEGESFANEYHTFGLEWNETSITFTLDGRAFITMDTTVDARSKNTYNDYVQLLFSLYSGVEIGLTTGQPDETTDWKNNDLAIEYVHLYQMPGQGLEYKK